MNKDMVTNGENREPKRIDIYEEFVLWSAMPPSERMRLGIETQEEFVAFYKIGTNTPTRWKRRPDFELRVTALRREWAFGKTGAVIEGIYRSALKGNPFSQKLWLQYFLGFTERTETTTTNKVEVGVNDVRFIIDGLPEPECTKFHGYIREIVEFANMVKQAGTANPGVWDEQRLEEYVYTEAPIEKTEPIISNSLRSSSSCDPHGLLQTTAAGWATVTFCADTQRYGARIAASPQTAR